MLISVKISVLKVGLTAFTPYISVKFYILILSMCKCITCNFKNNLKENLKKQKLLCSQTIIKAHNTPAKT